MGAMVEGMALDGNVVDSMLGKPLGVIVGLVIDSKSVGALLLYNDGTLEVNSTVGMYEDSMEGRLLLIIGA